MHMNYGAHLRTHPIDIAVKAPFARRRELAAHHLPFYVQLHYRVRIERRRSDAGWGDEAAAVAACTDVAGRAFVQSADLAFARNVRDRRAQIGFHRRLRGHDQPGQIKGVRVI